jgi:hypothetical protein
MSDTICFPELQNRLNRLSGFPQISETDLKRQVIDRIV